jgi:2-oxoglutarate/2-oxoacid ferredoxin oxidoreductase subunit beta
VGEDALLVHDEARPDPTLAFALSRLAPGPTAPTPVGVFRAVERAEYATLVSGQVTGAALLASGGTWEV